MALFILTRVFAIADYLHISETSTLKLLEALGGECAGLISFLSEDEDDFFQKKQVINSLQRLHQEDFCQALGIMSTSKYQNDGGPGILKICAFNYVMGNCDSHGKNYSLLYKNIRVELFPLYDVVSTIIYSGLTDKLSMKIGKHYEIQKVTQEDFSLLAESLNIKYSVLSNIFDDFAKKYINAFDELKKC